MKLSVSVSGAVPVGPEHVTFDVPERAHIEVIDKPPYDLDINLVFSDEAQRLEITELTLRRQDDGEPLRMPDGIPVVISLSPGISRTKRVEKARVQKALRHKEGR